MFWSSRLALACSLALSAQASLINNGSFENPVSPNTPALDTGSTYLDEWTVFKSQIAHVRTADFPFLLPQQGTLSLDLTGYNDEAPYGGVMQTITTVPGYLYTLTFHIAARNGQTTLRVTAGNLNENVSVTAAQDQVWQLVSRQFIALSPTTNVQFVGVSASSASTYIGLDNVSVDEIGPGVPEPESVALVLLGLGAVAWRRSLS
jgi:hypothetical protein